MKKFTSLPSLREKKNLLVIMALSIAAIPTYGSGVASCLMKQNNPYYQGECKTVTLNGKTYNLGKIHGQPASTRAGKEDVIHEAKGTEKMYNKDCYGTFVLYNGLELYNDVFPASVVWDDNNDVYVKDIISTMPTDTYVKGVLDGDEITFQAGQVVDFISDDQYGDYGIAVGLARTEIHGNLADFYYDPSITEFRYKVGKNGSLSLQLPGEPFNGEDPTEYVLCLYYTDDLQFIGFSDFYQEYTEVKYQAVKMPFGVPQEEYVIVDEFDFASILNVAFTKDYIYIEGLNPMLPEGVVRAKINGNKAVIAQNDYLGIYMGMEYIFTKVLYDNPDFDPLDEESIPFIFAPEDVGFELTFDKEAGVIVSENKGVYLCFIPQTDDLNRANCIFEDFILRYQATSEGTPANPTHLSYKTDWVTYQGFADFQFFLSNSSTEGMVLDAEHLYYSVIVNGKPIIFEEGIVENMFGYPAEAYPLVPEKQIWLPYLFNNNEDIMKFSSTEFDIGIYVKDVETIGVQSRYVYNGKDTYSDVVTLDVKTGDITTTPAGVDSMTVAPVVKTEYYTIGGLKVENPQNGIFIKRDVQSDGKIVVSKQLIP